MRQHPVPGPAFAASDPFCFPGCHGYGGLGPAVLEQLVAHQLVSSPVDLYSLNKEALVDLERMGGEIGRKPIERRGEIQRE